MLASDPDFFTEHLPSPSSLTYFHALPSTACTPSPSDFNGPFQPSPASSDFQAFDYAGPQYMSGIVHQNPTIRIEESAPTPAHPISAAYPQHSDNNAYTRGEANGQMVVATGIPSLRTPVFNRKPRSHQRAQSIGSSGSSSPFSQSHATSFPYGIQESRHLRSLVIPTIPMIPRRLAIAFQLQYKLRPKTRSYRPLMLAPTSFNRPKASSQPQPPRWQ